MTYTEFIFAVYQMKKDYPCLRTGQAIMNVLFRICPTLYNKVNRTELDTFYNDDKIDDLLILIYKELENGKY